MEKKTNTAKKMQIRKKDTDKCKHMKDRKTDRKKIFLKKVFTLTQRQFSLSKNVFNKTNGLIFLYFKIFNAKLYG